VSKSKGLDKLDRLAAEEVIAAVMRIANLAADLAIAFIRDAKGLSTDLGQMQQPIGLPAAFLLELGAVLVLQRWERSGIKPYLSREMPSARDGMQSLGRRAMQGPSAFSDDCISNSINLIIAIAVYDLAWGGPEDLGAEAVVGDIDDNSLIGAVAELLWSHRHDDSPFDEAKAN
jgi:hypothetical protein